MVDDRDERLRLVYEAARLFYVEKRSKSQIANKMGVSNTQATRYLKEAEANGIIKLSLTPPRIQSLEQKLISRFPCLKEIMVIPASGDHRFQLQKLGQIGAAYLDSQIDQLLAERPGKPLKIGLSGGNTVFELVQALPARVRDIEIYPAALIGRGPFIPEHIDPMVLISMLWNKSGRREKSAYYVTIPPFDKDRTPEEIVSNNEILKQHPKVGVVWQGMQRVDLLIASVGCFKTQGQRTLLNLLADIGITQATLERDGIVGDIAYSMLDADGNPHHPREAKGDLFITLGVKRLQEMAREYPKCRVVLIAGKDKEEGLLAALRGGACNVLICDDATAERVLSMDPSRPSENRLA
jgi:DNA-binding transcriptional regulator LsrR (DeoR family)